MTEVLVLVKQLTVEDRTVYQCELCDMGYSDLETAERCEEYCSTHEACSLDITRHAIHKPTEHFMP